MLDLRGINIFMPTFLLSMAIFLGDFCVMSYYIIYLVGGIYGTYWYSNMLGCTETILVNYCMIRFHFFFSE
jgi:hypothetical protein